MFQLHGIANECHGHSLRLSCNPYVCVCVVCVCDDDVSTPLTPPPTHAHVYAIPDSRPVPQHNTPTKMSWSPRRAGQLDARVSASCPSSTQRRSHLWFNDIKHTDGWFAMVAALHSCQQASSKALASAPPTCPP